MPETAIVGRESELQRLEALLDNASAGRGRTWLVSGEAGSGKSTLVQALISKAKERENVAVAIVSCNAGVGIRDSYLPFVEIINELQDIETTQAGIWRKGIGWLRSFMRFSKPVRDEFGSELLELLSPRSMQLFRVVKVFTKDGGSPSRIDQQQIFASYTKYLKKLSERFTVVLILDDLHWADASSWWLLRHLAKVMFDKHLLLIGTYRANEVALHIDDSRHPMASIINELTRDYGNIVIDLDYHDEHRLRSFVRDLLDREPNELDDAWCESLFRHTRGNPLFTVELIRDLKARNVLVQNGQGAWVAAGPTNWSVVPPQVDGVIEERIDRLEPNLREILRTASVEGEIFTAEIVARILDISERKVLRKLSDELQKRYQLVKEDDVRKIGRSTLSLYAFNHWYFQQYLYEHLGRGERIKLHQSVGKALEELYEGHTDDVASQLAHHYGLAGDHEKAYEYSMRVVRRSGRISAYDEVLAQTDMALEILPKFRDEERDSPELDVQLERGAAFQAEYGWSDPQTVAAFARGLELAERLPVDARIIPLLFGRFAELLTRGRYPQAREIAERLKSDDFVEMANRGITLGVALGVSCFWLGEIVESRDASAEGLVAPTVPGVQPDTSLIRVILLRQMMLDEFILGNEGNAAKYREELVASAKDSDRPFNIYFTRPALAWDAYNHRDPSRTRIEAELALNEDTKEFKFKFYHGQSLIFRAWAGGMFGEPDALERVDKAYAMLSRHGTYFYSIYVAMKAELLLLNGEPQQALAWINDGLKGVVDLADLVYLSELHRYRGDILVTLGEPDDARESYHAAINVARQQHAKVFEDRAVDALKKISN